MTDPSFGGYGLRIGEINTVVSKLRDLGLQTVLNIPLIAVIGNQSAGKSSLVEAICGITLPRSEGTCTRCPTEIEMSCAKDWSCSIKLRIDHDISGAKLNDVRIIPFGDKVVSRKKLDKLLRKAQEEILKPEVITDNKSSALSTANGNTNLEFSKNTICIEVAGPGMTSLSFVDLPGVIQNTDPGKKHLIKLVEDMIRSYISRPSCLILSVITMSDDIENQAAPHIARELDPKGGRTIGVLTKPDRMPEGARSQWKKLFTGEKHPLYHGYYLTIQKSDDEGDIKPGQPDTREQHWLHSGKWDEVPASRRGVAALTHCLSNLLGNKLREQIPEISQTARTKLADTRRLLNGLPKQILDAPIIYIHARCAELSGKINQAVVLGGQPGEFWKDWHKAENRFVQGLLEARPRFDVPAKDNDELVSLTDYICKGDFAVSGKQTSPHILTLADVRSLWQNARTVEIGTHVAYQVKAELFQSSICGWESAVMELLDSTCDSSTKFVHTCVDKVFSSLAVTALDDRFREIALDLLQRQKDKTAAILTDWLETERELPHTLSLRYMTELTEEIFSHAEYLREGGFRAEEGKEEPLNTAKAALAELGYTVGGLRELSALATPYEYAQELRIISECLAYFCIAVRRQWDVVPMTIQRQFVRGFAKELETKLAGELLGKGTYEELDMRAASLVAEDNDIVKQRSDLEVQAKMLSDAVELLRKFGSAK